MLLGMLNHPRLIPSYLLQACRQSRVLLPALRHLSFRQCTKLLWVEGRCDQIPGMSSCYSALLTNTSYVDAF